VDLLKVKTITFCFNSNTASSSSSLFGSKLGFSQILQTLYRPFWWCLRIRYEIWSAVNTLSGAAVAGFGRDLRSSESGQPGEILFFFDRQITHDFTDFPSAKFHKIWTQHVDRWGGEFFRNKILNIFWIFSCKGSFCQKIPKFHKNFQRLVTSGGHNSTTIIDHKNSLPSEPSMGCLVSIFTARRSRNARIASAVLAIAFPSVCPSIRLSAYRSHAGIVSKQRHIAWCSLHCQIAECV